MSAYCSTQKTQDVINDLLLVLCFRPNERTGEDLDIIYSRLKDLKAFENFHPLLLQQICYYSYYENLDQGVICKCYLYKYL